MGALTQIRFLRQHPDSAIRETDGVLEVCRQTTVCGLHRPTISIDFGRLTAHIEHRLDADRHATPEFQPGSLGAVVGDLRILMHLAADSMTHVLSDHAKVLPFCLSLNGVTYVAQPGPLSDLLDTGPQGGLCGLEKSLHRPGQLADAEGDSGVAVISLENRTGIAVSY